MHNFMYPVLLRCFSYLKYLPVISIFLSTLSLLIYTIQWGFYGGKAWGDPLIYYLLWPGLSFLARFYIFSFNGFPDIIFIILLPAITNWCLAQICFICFKLLLRLLPV